MANERKYGGNVNFTLSEEYAAKLDRIAEREKRGQSAQAHWFIEEAIDHYERIDAQDEALPVLERLRISDGLVPVGTYAVHGSVPIARPAESEDDEDSALPV